MFYIFLRFWYPWILSQILERGTDGWEVLCIRAVFVPSFFFFCLHSECWGSNLVLLSSRIRRPILKDTNTVICYPSYPQISRKYCLEMFSALLFFSLGSKSQLSILYMQMWGCGNRVGGGSPFLWYTQTGNQLLLFSASSLPPVFCLTCSWS